MRLVHMLADPVNDKDACLTIVGLIATLPTRETLLRVAIPSIAKQARQLNALVIVTDNFSMSASVVKALRRQLPRTDVHFLSNAKAGGVANTWNTGIEYIAAHWPEAYIAILDDDDQWDPEHLSLCEEETRRAGWPDAVVSGLRVLINGAEVECDPPLCFSIEDFLTGNPGWQGSNTFIRLTTLIEVGCFTEGLKSCNDRDLAIRVLSRPDPKLVFTGKHTASWNLDSDRTSLSSRRSDAKRIGLAQFLALHGHRMNEAVRHRFFKRAENLFGWSEEEIQAEVGVTAHA